MPRLFLLAESSIERCLEFTEGTEAEGLLSVLSVRNHGIIRCLSWCLFVCLGGIGGLFGIGDSIVATLGPIGGTGPQIDHQRPYDNEFVH